MGVGCEFSEPPDGPSVSSQLFLSSCRLCFAIVTANPRKPKLQSNTFFYKLPWSSYHSNRKVTETPRDGISRTFLTARRRPYVELVEAHYQVLSTYCVLGTVLFIPQMQSQTAGPHPGSVNLPKSQETGKYPSQDVTRAEHAAMEGSLVPRANHCCHFLRDFTKDQGSTELWESPGIPRWYLPSKELRVQGWQHSTGD